MKNNSPIVLHIDPVYPDKLKAQEDLPCYKILIIKSNLLYVDLYNTYLFDVTKPQFKIKGSIKIKNFPNSPREYAENGFVSFSTLEKAQSALSRFTGNYKIGKFVIPKNSAYYYSEIGSEYISSDLNFVELIK